MCKTGFPRPFQSTLPVGGATRAASRTTGGRRDFNPRSPWGERLSSCRQRLISANFNPRSPWGERPGCAARRADNRNFNPRSPWGERLIRLINVQWPTYFNPRSPWGERLLTFMLSASLTIFQSTLPVGGATSDMPDTPIGVLFQSTLPVGGATNRWRRNHGTHNHFNPRSPWGERLLGAVAPEVPPAISIHAPRGGSDAGRVALFSVHCLFQSTLPVGGATEREILGLGTCAFQSTLPVGGATRLRAILAGKIKPFQSTLPVGGATRIVLAIHLCFTYFNPRSPWGERPDFV